MDNFALLGFGCGLRPEHVPVFLEQVPSTVDWVEIIAESYLSWSDGRAMRSAEALEKIRQDYPLTIHGVSLNLGSVDPLDLEHLKLLRGFIERTQPAWYSDHLCWTGVGGHSFHDLLPLPYTEEAVVVACEKIQQVQDFLGQRILIENVSSYVSFDHSEMAEWEFLNEVSRRSGCGVLLDINNVYVNSRNQHFDPIQYLAAISPESVGQIHLAGHEDRGSHLVDTHDAPVSDEVWNLYRWTLTHKGRFSTLVEWDNNVPPWNLLEAQVQMARALATPDRTYANHPIAVTAHV